jgi:hypothetical protein
MLGTQMENAWAQAAAKSAGVDLLLCAAIARGLFLSSD